MKNEINSLEREQGELREQPCNDSSFSSSHEISGSGNIGNGLINVENPIDTQPNSLSEPMINRPCYISYQDWFKLNDKKMKPGLYFHGEHQERDGGVIPIDEWLSSPLTIGAITSSPTDNDFGRLLRFVDSNGKWHDWAMPMHMLKGSGEELRGELLNQGVIFNLKRRNHIAEYIMTERPNRRITAANKVGWYGNVSFVLPNQVIGKKDVVFQSEMACLSEFTTSGTLLDWQQEIGKLCEGNTSLMVSVSAALAGPLLKLTNREQGAGIHWVGDSSSGKSTAAEVAASIWGSKEFVRSWSATANGIEGIAASRNDTCLVLDEIDEASPHEIGKIVYMLANGQGKQRAGRIGNAREIHRWRIMTISTGERTLDNIMKEIGRQTNSGQLVRLLSIPASFEHGVFTNLHGFNDGRSLADHLKTVRLKHYGHVGNAFISFLMEDKRDLPGLLDKIIQKFNMDFAATNLEMRAAGVFAVIGMAGELGIEYSLLPWTQGGALEAARLAFLRWKNFQGSSQTEDQRILQAVSDFIAKHGDSRFSYIENKDDKTSNRAGWYKKVEDDGRIFMFTSYALQEAGGGYDRKRIVDALVRHKWIVDKDSSRSTKKTRTSSGSQNLYYIRVPQEEI